MPTPTVSPAVASTIGLKDVVYAKLTVDTSATITYDTLQALSGAIDAQIAPENSDPDVQYYDDTEGNVLYADPEIKVTLEMADLPLAVQEDLLGNTIDINGVLVRKAGDTPPYFALGFKSLRTDNAYRYVWLLKGRAKPVTETYHTSEGKTITRQTGKLEITFIKRTHDGEYQYIADEGLNGFDTTDGTTFLQSVYTPVYTTPPAQQTP